MARVEQDGRASPKRSPAVMVFPSTSESDRLIQAGMENRVAALFRRHMTPLIDFLGMSLSARTGC